MLRLIRPEPRLRDLGPENPLLPAALEPEPAADPTSLPTPDLQSWDPAGDLYLPRNAGAELFVPPAAAVPPQLPGPLDRRSPLEFEPHGAEYIFSNASQGDFTGRQLGFVAHSVSVDNYSGAWLYFPAARTWVPPFQWRAMLQLQSGTEVAQYFLQDAYGVRQNTSAAPINTIWYEDYFAPSAGADISGAVEKGQINVFSVVAVTIAGVPVLSANASRRSAFFQNLGANQIDLGPDDATIWTPAVNTGIRLAGGQTPPTSFNDTSTIGPWRAIATTGTTNLLVIEVS